MNVLLCCTDLRSKNYIEYTLIRRKQSQTCGKYAETASVTILCIWITLEYYYADIEEFAVPFIYLILLLMLLLQKLGMFFVKLALFPFFYLTYALISSCLECCRDKSEKA